MAEAGEVIETAWTYLYEKLLIGIIILLIGFGLGILARKLALRILKEIELNRIMNRVGVSYNLEKGVSSIISYVIYLFTIIIFLEQLEIKSIVLYLAAGALLMLVILTMFVGLKDVVPNFIGWLYLQKDEKMKEGYKINIREIAGTIEKIGWLETEIRTDNDDILYVPNALFLKSKHRVKK